ncbi:MAG: hypothetical protein VCB82_05345 [Alphaproteobacteria bacterium]|jgi:hypothetical protein|nr:MAG: hypothetical protein CFH36_00661 [Alphaproteobacteria bacterium MarineAlpha9_Bin6]HIA22660.1 hypothetical protein [Alphaproteobacteria bacterium]HIB18347.1 hypothetical protein [Alphaproteobacteria bacterium]HIB55858.1 hypothetical protein [Alphaproteobacteria bacterium]HIN91187.1 hypothetical protein [Alphaproteobacteria bacterium]
MSRKWDYQIRINLSDSAAQLLRRDPKCEEMASLAVILKRHNATLKCQFDAFADYVTEAEKYGVKNYPLYEWTKATILDPVKKAKYLKSFSLYVGSKEVYPKCEADTLEADLKSMAGGEMITQIFKYDTNPANNPQPPANSTQ